jgi:hypothetical protein
VKFVAFSFARFIPVKRDICNDELAIVPISKLYYHIRVSYKTIKVLNIRYYLLEGGLTDELATEQPKFYSYGC